MTSPETSLPHNNQEAVDRLNRGLEITLASESNPDVRQHALLTAFIDTLDRGVSPEVYERIKSLEATLTAARERAMSAAEEPPATEEAVTAPIPLYQQPVQPASVPPSETSSSLEAPTVERTDRHMEERLATEVIPYISHRALYGKIPRTVLPALNGQVSALAVERAHNDESLPFGNVTLGEVAQTLYSAVHAIRSAEASFPGTHSDIKQAVVIGQLPVTTRDKVPTGETVVEVSVPVNALDHAQRAVYAFVVSTKLPEDRANHLLGLFADPDHGSDAVQAYVKKVAPGIWGDANFTKGGYILTQEQTKRLHALVAEKRRPGGNFYNDVELAQTITMGQRLVAN